MWAGPTLVRHASQVTIEVPRSLLSRTAKIPSTLANHRCAFPQAYKRQVQLIYLSTTSCPRCIDDSSAASIHWWVLQRPHTESRRASDVAGLLSIKRPRAPRSSRVSRHPGSARTLLELRTGTTPASRHQRAAIDSAVSLQASFEGGPLCAHATQLPHQIRRQRPDGYTHMNVTVSMLQPKQKAPPLLL
jgi:hypothetical protein